MPRVQIFAYVVAGVLGAQVGLTQPGSAIECPEPQAQDFPRVVPESAQEIAELSALLASSDIENRVEMIAQDLRQKYPNVDATDLTNFMITAYCPVVAAIQGLSESARRERLDGFSHQVWQIYSRQSQ